MAIKKVKSIAEFIKLAQRDIGLASLAAIEEVAKQASEVLTRLTGQWYSSHMPTTYDRTYEFINSITISQPVFKSGGWFIGVYFDPDKMSLGNNNGWDQHADRFNLSEIIEDGWQAGGKFIQGSGALLTTSEWASVGNFSRIVETEFKRLGFNIK